jgi:hypothetical protein
MINDAPGARRRAHNKAGADLWQSGRRRQISHTMNGCGIQAQQALP